MTTPDPIRALLIGMADELDHSRQCLMDDRRLTHPLADRARSALAAEADGPAVPEGGEPASVVSEPSDEEIMRLMPQQMHEDLAAAVRAMAEQEGIDSTPARGIMRIILNRHVIDLARAVLARWGRPAAPPAPLAEPEAVTEDSSAPPSPTPLMGEPNKLRAALNRIESLVEQANAAFKPLAELLDSPTTPPAPLEGEVPGDWFTVALVAQDMRSRGLAEQLAGDELLKMANNHQTRPAAPPAPVVAELAELAAKLRRLAPQNPLGIADPTITRAATLLSQLSAAAPAVVPVAVDGWQPIDTAPVDGTEILASDYDAINIVSYGEWERGVFGWTNRELEAVFPAWWQPLPDHPPLPTTTPAGQEVKL